MKIRQEIPQRRTYTVTPRGHRAVPKYREQVDYSALPDWSLLGISEVALLTRMSKSVIERRVKEGTFAAPNYHGKDRVWSLGYVRQWCQENGTPVEGGEA